MLIPKQAAGPVKYLLFPLPTNPEERTLRKWIEELFHVGFAGREGISSLEPALRVPVVYVGPENALNTVHGIWLHSDNGPFGQEIVLHSVASLRDITRHGGRCSTVQKSKIF